MNSYSNSSVLLDIPNLARRIIESTAVQHENSSNQLLAVRTKNMINNLECNKEEFGITRTFQILTILLITAIPVLAVPSSLIIIRVIGKTDYLPTTFRRELQIIAFSNISLIAFQSFRNYTAIRANTSGLFCARGGPISAFIGLSNSLIHCGTGIERYLATRALLKKTVRWQRISKYSVLIILVGSCCLGLITAGASQRSYSASSALVQQVTNNKTECVCQRKPTRTLFSAIALICLTVSIVTGLYHKVWRQSKTELNSWSLNTAQHSLQERFALRMNIYITKTIMPVVLAHYLLRITGMIIISVFMTITLSAPTQRYLGVLGTLPAAIEVIIFPWLIICTNEQMRITFLAMFGKCTSPVQTIAPLSPTNTLPTNPPPLAHTGNNHPLPNGNVPMVGQRLSVDHIAIMTSMWHKAGEPSSRLSKPLSGDRAKTVKKKQPQSVLYQVTTDDISFVPHPLAIND